ncbi:MAG: hypothetical protein V2A67_06270 [Bacteroidota bacterium]
MKHEKFRFKTGEEIKTKALELGVKLPWSDSIDVLLQPVDIAGIKVPNRLAVQPMEGFDADENGTPGELAFRRYNRYAAGGSGMIWFEACSLVPDGRSNPHQLMLTGDNVHVYRKLTDQIRATAEENFGKDHRPFLVLQFTHSGRYSKPTEDFQPKIFSNNPVLDSPHPLTLPTSRDRFSPALPPVAGEGEPAIPKPQLYFTDSEIDAIKSAYIQAFALAEQAGFDAVDVKACHGYLLHEMLYAYDRTDSRYGGSFERRTRFLTDVLATKTPLVKSVRLNATDMIPYPYGFGMKRDGSAETDLDEVKKLISILAPNVPLWNISAGIPKLNAHIGRPYDRGVFNAPLPDEHPLEGISRLINITGELQLAFPDLRFVGSAYSWLRQFFPNVGAGILNQKKVSFIGLGRSSFAYPDAPKDLMDKGMLDPEKVCVSCSKCTELMRKGMATGCAVRDSEYKGKRQKAEGKN